MEAVLEWREERSTVVKAPTMQERASDASLTNSSVRHAWNAGVHVFDESG